MIARSISNPFFTLPFVALVSCGRANAAPPAPADCHRDIADTALWGTRTDAQLVSEITRATACARTRHTHVLLEFVATWCPDCQQMTNLEHHAPVARVLSERYERVRVDVGAWDHATALRQRYNVTRIASYVVLDANTGAVLAQRLAEPVTGSAGPIDDAAWASWLAGVH